jgi:O-antigen/teichoic acid export membrane protein
VDTVILWFTVKWRPKLLFSFKRLKTLFSFGWKILASSLLDTVYGKVRQLIIGKKYSSEDLAFYNKGHSLPELIINNICSAINSVLFPTMSAEQDNIPLLKKLTRRSIQLSTYTIVPIMVGLGVCAEPLIRLLLTEKWIASVFYMRIFCFSFALYPIHIANLNAIKAMGRSDLFLKLEIIKKAIGLVALLMTMWISVEAMAYSLLVTGVIGQVVNSWPNKKLMQYGYLEQIKDIFPSILLSLGMGTVVYLVQWLALPDFATLCIQVPLGIVLYVVGSKLFKFQEFEYLLGTLKNRSRRKKTT